MTMKVIAGTHMGKRLVRDGDRAIVYDDVDGTWDVWMATHQAARFLTGFLAYEEPWDVPEEWGEPPEA